MPVHYFDVDARWWKAMKTNQKTIEARPAETEILAITAGDALVFTNQETEQTLVMRVRRVEQFKNFNHLLEMLLDKVFPGVDSLREGLEICRALYPQEGQKIVALFLN